MSDINENPKTPNDKGFIEGAKDSISKNIEETKDSLSKSYEGTKDSISESVDSGIKKTKSFFRKVLIFSSLALLLVGIGYMVWANWTYSEGTRTGYMMKISKKGYVFKTFEGQLNLGGLQEDQSSVIGSTWNFSLKEGFLAKKLEELEGKKVQLRYKEINRAMPWQGDTNYYVYDIEEK